MKEAVSPNPKVVVQEFWENALTQFRRGTKSGVLRRALARNRGLVLTQNDRDEDVAMLEKTLRRGGKIEPFTLTL